MTLQTLRICDIASAGTFRHTPITMGERAKRPLYQFFHFNFHKHRNYSQNVLTFRYNPFTILVQHFKAIPSAGPKLLNLSQDHTSKKIFWSNSYKSEVMITSLTEMLELPNFGQMTTSEV